MIYTIIHILILTGVLVAAWLLNNTNQNIANIMAKLSTLADTLNAIETTLEKVQTEVQALKDSLQDVDLPAEAQAALDKLTATAKAIDDINPDAPTPET